jgi:hypothetical protein
MPDARQSVRIILCPENYFLYHRDFDRKLWHLIPQKNPPLSLQSGAFKDGLGLVSVAVFAIRGLEEFSEGE